MTAPQPLPEPTGQLVRVHYQEGRTAWWWAHYTDATVQPDEIGVVIGRTADRNFENYYVRLLGRPHDVTFAATEFSPCDLATENADLRAQAEEIELLVQLEKALTAFDAASAEEDAAMEALMSASQNAPTNERGQFLDPEAVHRAAEPFRPRHCAAQDARMEAQEIIDGFALESARLAVKLAGGRAALAQAGGDGQ